MRYPPRWDGHSEIARTGEATFRVSSPRALLLTPTSSGGDAPRPGPGPGPGPGSKRVGIVDKRYVVATRIAAPIACCDSEGARVLSDAELARADIAPMHRTRRVRPGALLLVVRSGRTPAGVGMAIEPAVPCGFKE